MLEGPERLLTTGATVLEGPAFKNRSNSAGGTREVVHNMRISAGVAREVGNRRRNSA